MNVFSLSLLLACAMQLFSTNVLAAAPWLTINSVNSNEYGYRFNGRLSEETRATFRFKEGVRTRQLTLKGYDIDSDTEVKILINGKKIGNLASGANNGLETTQILIPTSFLTESINTLAFVQRSPGDRWGVTDITISNIPTLELEAEDRDSYGYRYSGAVTQLTQASFRIMGKPANDTELQVIGFDIDTNVEVSVFMNNVALGNLSKGTNDGFNENRIPIPRSAFTAGENILSFRQNSNEWKWGVSDILISKLDPQPSKFLTLGVANENKFGYSFDGILTNPKGVTFTFENPQSGPLDVLTLDVEGYDIDSNREVAIYVNNKLIGYLAESENNGLLLTTLPIQIDEQIRGTNRIRFTQATEGTRWGVTDIMITSGCNYPLIIAN